MAPLAKTNRYLRDPEKRRRLVTDSVRQSSVFEGARNLKVGPSSTQACQAWLGRIDKEASEHIVVLC